MARLNVNKNTFKVNVFSYRSLNSSKYINTDKIYTYLYYFYKITKQCSYYLLSFLTVRDEKIIRNKLKILTF